MSNNPLNVVAYRALKILPHAIVESTQDSMDADFIILAGQHKIMGSWSKPLKNDYVELMALKL